MLEVRRVTDGRLELSGRLDASQVEVVRSALAEVNESCVLDFAHLEYISSLGLGVLLEAQKRLMEAGHGLTLTNLSDHLKDLFALAGFDLIFEIE
jgi:anti-sigma B factor antagonist